jgi:Ca-activated chloride channel family protein
MTDIAEPLHIELQTQNPADRIALRGVHLRARIAGMSLKATIEQTFVNLEERAIEALYTFPLADGAAVCGFEVVFFDKVFTGVVDETDQAIEKYDDAISQGHGAYLLEHHRPDVFSVRVGNLKPRQAVTIRLTYVTDLQIVDRAIRLSFPTTIAPRYATASGTDPIDAAIDGDALNPPHVLSVPYGLSMEMEIDLGKALANVTSPSHRLTLPPSPGTPGEGRGEGLVGKPVTITLATTLAEMNRDLVLVLNLTKEQTPYALASTSDQGEQFIAVNFLPEFEETDLSRSTGSETIFLLDCSGSMQGESIQQASAALDCCLRAMSPGDTFNICRFGSTFQLLSPEPLLYSQETMARALKFVHQQADLGGTEILAPLEAILSHAPATGAVRNIVLLTDGQVTNEPAVIALAKRKRARNRIFTFGIGAASSSFLVNSLARVTGGAAEFIASGERIEDKVLRTFGRLASPPVTDVEIDWHNADAQIAPRHLPPLFDGDALRIYALLPGRIPETVTLQCNTATGPKSWTVPVRQGADPAKVLPTLWARAMIRTLEEEEGVQATASISAPSSERTRLIEISKRYNLLCSLTSFLAVEHRSLEDRNEGKPELRRVPVTLAAGWGGVEATPSVATLMAAGPCVAMSAPMAAPPAPAPRGRSTKGFAGADSESATFGFASSGRGGFMDALKRKVLGQTKEVAEYGNENPSAQSKPADKLFILLSRQMADGSFDPSTTNSALHLRKAGQNPVLILNTIDQLFEDAKIPMSKRENVRVTLFAMATLHLVFADRRPLWKRAFKKALDWVCAQGLPSDQIDLWMKSLHAAA